MSDSLCEFINANLTNVSIIVMTDLQGVITEVNEAFCTISKYSREDLIGKNHSQLLSDYNSKDYKDYFKSIGKITSSRNVWQGEICHKAKDGTIYWVHGTIIPIKNSNGIIDQFLTMMYDITKQKEDDFNSDLLNKIQSLLFGKHHNLSWIRDEVCKLLLTETHSEWVYLKFYDNDNNDIHKPYMLPLIWSRIDSDSETPFSSTSFNNNVKYNDFVHWTFNLPQPFVFQYANKPLPGLPLLAQEGTLKNFVAFPLVFNSKKIGTLGIANSKLNWFANRVFSLTKALASISQMLMFASLEIEKDSAFKKLQSQEKQLRHFIQSLPISAIIIDSHHKILEISHDWLKTFDLPSSSVVNQNLWNLFPSYPKQWKKLVEDAFKGKSLKAAEEQYITHKGRTLWLEWTVSPWLKENQVGGAVIIINNLTEQKDLYREIEQLRFQQLITSKMASLGEIAGGIAHEINNPLTITVGIAEKLKRHAEANRITPELILQSSEKLHAVTDRITAIIKGLKSFARDAKLDAIITYSLVQIIQDAQPYIETKLKKLNIEFRTSIPKDFLIECRPVQITQALVNLIHNACDAIEYMSEKWISLEVIEEAKGVIIKIKDSGNGIPPVIADKIMDPFFTTKDIGRGTGLGLSITKSIVETHRGILFLDTHSANTCFIMRLPKLQSVQLDIQNGREALAFHLAWKQRLIDALKTNFVGFSLNNDPILDWIKNAKALYGYNENTEALIESFYSLFEETKIIFNRVVHNADVNFASEEFLRTNSHYNTLSKTFVIQLIALEQKRETTCSQKVS